MAKKKVPIDSGSPFPLTWDPDTTVVLQWSRNLASYAEGYRCAAEFLADAVLEGKHVGKALVHDLVYPILFLYRHHVELRLKEMIVIARECVWKRAVCQSDDGLRAKTEQVKLPCTHDLLCLWAILEPLLGGLDPDPTSGTTKDIGKRLKLLAKLDPMSDSFRYPFSSRKRGRRESLRSVTRLDVRGVRQKLGQLVADLGQCSANLSAHWESIEEAWEIGNRGTPYLLPTRR